MPISVKQKKCRKKSENLKLVLWLAELQTNTHRKSAGKITKLLKYLESDLEEASLCSIVEGCGSCAVLLVHKFQFLHIWILSNKSIKKDGENKVRLLPTHRNMFLISFCKGTARLCLSWTNRKFSWHDFHRNRSNILRRATYMSLLLDTFFLNKFWKNVSCYIVITPANRTCRNTFVSLFNFTFKSRSIVLSCPTAQCRAVLLFSSSQVTSAPLSNSSDTTAEQPWAAAKSNGVHFSRSRGFKSTPCEENVYSYHSIV